MKMNDYQFEALETAIYPNQGEFGGLVYVALKGAGEAGEFAENVGKAIRDDGGKLTPERREKLIYECGDQLWYIAAKARELGITLAEVAALNLKKLADRKERGKLQGSGDNR